MLQIPMGIPKSHVLESESNTDVKLVLHSFSVNREETIDKEVDELTDVKKYGHKIYDEFVRVGCNFEINIAGGQRNAVKNIVGDYQQFMDANINANDLFVVFQECKDEIEMLIKYSLVRYKERNEFTQMQQVLNIIETAISTK